MMKLVFSLILLTVFFLGCASKKTATSAEAKAELETKYSAKVGTATKMELIEEFGNAEWCKFEDHGGETCRFYVKKGTRWVGDKRDRKSVDQFDEVIAEFDKGGVLKTYKTRAGR